MVISRRQKRESRLKRVREEEGWSLGELARAADISPATLAKAEGEQKIRSHFWGKILKAINNMPNKTRMYEMSDIHS